MTLFDKISEKLARHTARTDEDGRALLANLAKLNDRQGFTLTHALTIAAERFDEDAAEFERTREAAARAIANGGRAWITPLGAEQLRDQFKRQAADTRALIAIVNDDGEDEDEDGDEDEELELGDDRAGSELEPEAGYILLDGTDGEGEELDAYLAAIPSDGRGLSLMDCGREDITGAIVRRIAADAPATEIWATGWSEPSDPTSRFCLIYKGEGIGGEVAA